MIKLLLRFFILLDNMCYKAISKLVVLRHHGIHPKHDIMKYHTFFIDQVDATDRVIDIGCGNGLVAYDVAQKAHAVVGIDMNASNIEKACSLSRKENMQFIVGDACTHTFDEIFDKIILSNVLEHIEDRVSFLTSLHNVSGTILLRVPMLDRDWLSVYKKQQDFEYRLDPTHYIEYTMPLLREELKQSGWMIQDYSIQFGEFWGIIKAYE